MEATENKPTMNSIEDNLQNGLHCSEKTSLFPANAFEEVLNSRDRQANEIYIVEVFFLLTKSGKLIKFRQYPVGKIGKKTI